MGSVYRKHEVWVIAYELPRTPGGKRRRKVLSCAGLTKRQAEQKLADIERDLRHGTHVEPSLIGFGEYLNDWLQSSTARLSPTTVWGHRSRIENHIRPILGNMPLAKVQPVHIDSLITGLIEKKTLSMKTVREIYSILHTALARAVRLRLIIINPADAVDIPKASRPSIKAADIAGVKRILEAAHKTPHWLPVFIAATTGLRRGEICGLRWEDLDSERKVLYVRRSIAQVPGIAPTVKDTKSGRERLVALPNVLLRELKRHRKEQLQAEAPYFDQGWICTMPNGECCRPDRITDAFAHIAEKAKVDITFHGLRHTQATLLLDAQIALPGVSERLGHASTSITANIYSHALPHMQTDAAIALDKIIGIPGEEPTDPDSNENAISE